MTQWTIRGALSPLTIIAACLFLFTGGIALAVSDEGEASLPGAPFGVPGLREGDRAHYVAEGGHWERHLALLAPEVVNDGERLVEAQVLDLREDRRSYWENGTYLVHPESGQSLAHRTFELTESEQPGFFGIPSPTRMTDRSYTEVTRVGGPQLPCGLWNPFQGEQVDLRQGVMAPCDGSQMRWQPLSEQVTPEGRVVLLEVEDDTARPPIRMVLRDDLPLPLRIEDGRTVWVLEAFTSGTGRIAAGDQGPAGFPSIRTAPRTPWLFDDSGLDHPFRLSEAYQAVLDHEAGEVRAFLRDHPEAYLHQTRYGAWQYETEERYLWGLAFGDGKALLQADAILTLKGAVVLGVEPLEDTREVQVEVGDREQGMGNVPSRDLLPERVPRLEDLMARYEVLRGEAPRDYGFSIGCHGCPSVSYGGQGGGRVGAPPPCTAACEGPYLQLDVGHSQGINHPPSPDGAMVRDYHQVMLSLDGAGTPYMQSARGRDVSFLEVPQETVSPAPASLDVATHARPVQTFAWGAVVVGGALAAAWAIKALALPLFSRLRRDALLDHPLRERIQDAIAADPGLHYQALVRRLDVPQGTLRHHIAALERGGLIRTVKGPRYTCYFLAGRADRHALQAAPVLRSEGARAVLAAIRSEPGLGTNELAARLGKSPSTVHAHLKRLEEAGIVNGGTTVGRKAWRVVRPDVADRFVADTTVSV